MIILDKKIQVDLGKLRNILSFSKNSFLNLHIYENHFIRIKRLIYIKELIYEVRSTKEFKMIDRMKF